jgi:hypothetical protein
VCFFGSQKYISRACQSETGQQTRWQNAKQSPALLENEGYHSFNIWIAGFVKRRDRDNRRARNGHDQGSAFPVHLHLINDKFAVPGYQVNSQAIALKIRKICAFYLSQQAGISQIR